MNIIIARYNESLEWLEDKRLNGADIIVYNKGMGKVGKKLKNIGREAHTYLTHILSNYETLHDTNVFLQADPFPHIKHDFLNDFKNLPDCFYGFNCHQTKIIVTTDCVKRNGARIFDENDSHAIFEICQMLKPKKEVYTLFVSHFACFSVPKRLILQYPKEFYQKLLDISINTPFGAHALEMLWMGMFDKDKLQ